MAKGLAYTVVLDAAYPLKTSKEATDEFAMTFPASSSEAQIGADITVRVFPNPRGTGVMQ